MCKENISQEFRLKNIDGTINYLIEVINRNELLSKKHKKVCTTLNYIENFLILYSTIIGPLEQEEQRGRLPPPPSFSVNVRFKYALFERSNAKYT